MLLRGFGSNDGKFFSERQREIFTKDSGGGGVEHFMTIIMEILHVLASFSTGNRADMR